MDTKDNEQFYRDKFFSEMEIRLGERFKAIDDQLSNIQNNHLSHIYGRLDKIEKRQAYYAGGIAVIVVVADAVMKFIK